MSDIKISTAKTIPLAVNSTEAKRIRLEMEERAATEVLANMSVSDNSTDMSRETLYTCDTDSDSDSERRRRNLTALRDATTLQIFLPSLQPRSTALPAVI